MVKTGALSPEPWRGGHAEFEALARQLKQELDAARTQYTQAREEFDRVVARAREAGLDSPESSLAIRQANVNCNQSLTIYQQALKRFCDLVIRRTWSEG